MVSGGRQEGVDVDHYSAWHLARPGKGYDGKALAWQARLDALK